jgi:type IX secretion system PorP/SprF family membrane protein
MRRYVQLSFSLFLLVSAALPTAAQEYVSSQYYSNLPIMNPGFTGIDDHLDLKVSANQGWNSFNINNNNIYVSVFGSLNSSRRALVNNNALRVSSSASQKSESEKQLRRKHGMGGSLAGRNVGPYRSLTVSYNYAYHIPLSSKFTFSLGTNLSYLNQRIDFSGFTLRNEPDDLFYNQLKKSGNGNQNSFLMDFGAVLYSNGFYFSVSSTNLIKSKLSSDQLLNYKDQETYQLSTAGNIRIGPTVMLNTGARVRYRSGSDLMWAVNTRLRYKELLYVGSGYGSGSQLSLLVGVTFTTRFNLHYSYDQYLSTLNAFNVNAHEIVLGIGISNKGNSLPKFW